MSRIPALSPPYEPAAGELLGAMMPGSAPPILLFRTFAQNLPMTSALTGWGGYELSDQMSLTLRDRKIVITRTCALCRCEYEWGVHIAFFADRAQLGHDQVQSLTHGLPEDPCWSTPRDRMLIAAADSLHEGAHLDDDLYTQLDAVFSHAEMLDLMMLAGWYHAISYVANGAQVSLEQGAPRFSDFDGPDPLL